MTQEKVTFWEGIQSCQSLEEFGDELVLFSHFIGKEFKVRKGKYLALYYLAELDPK